LSRSKGNAGGGQDEFVARLAALAEVIGLRRTAGRLFALLLLSEEPCSLDEIARRLGVTKAAISIDGRQLEERGLVVRQRRAGDRKHYYAITEDLFGVAMRQRISHWRDVRDAVREVRGQLDASSRAARSRLATLGALQRPARRHPAAHRTAIRKLTQKRRRASLHSRAIRNPAVVTSDSSRAREYL
jgi:DNA-binding MarR family transcriptional regulator